MAGSTYGELFRITTWGESHGEGLGVVVDGCPAGITVDESYIDSYMARRRPGQNRYSTPRMEGDKVKIMSGVFEGKTTGTPISMVVFNENQRSSDYSEIASYYRPGHADYTFDAKYGFRDYRGGGRSSGRETLSRVAAGSIAGLLLKELGVTVTAYTKRIGPVEIDYSRSSEADIMNSSVYMPDPAATKEACEYLENMISKKDSAGGIVECVVRGLPAGIGDPVFDKLDANIAKAVMSIGAVKGVEIGDGFAVAESSGSVNNDSFTYAGGKTGKLSNHSGGVLGGISDGNEFIFRAAFKPTPSIASKQHTINRNGEDIDIEIKGRHDPVIVPRAVVVVESMAAITIADMMLKGMTATIDRVKKFYRQ